MDRDNREKEFREGLKNKYLEKLLEEQANEIRILHEIYQEKIAVLYKALDLATEAITEAKEMLFASGQPDKANALDDGMSYYLTKARGAMKKE